MLSPKKFYEDLWIRKQGNQSFSFPNRDWLHRIVLDRIFDPLENPRHMVAYQLLGPGDRLLDIGSWDGRLLDLVSDAGLYQELHGVDISIEAVRKIESKGYSGKIVDLNTELLPFPEAYFDSVTALAVLEHIFDPFSLIQEIHRVLRPGGRLVIDVPNVASLTNRMRILCGRLPQTSSDPGWDGGHLHYFTKQALDDLLTNEGFRVIARKATGGHPGLREWWLSLLAGELIYLAERR